MLRYYYAGGTKEDISSSLGQALGYERIKKHAWRLEICQPVFYKGQSQPVPELHTFFIFKWVFNAGEASLFPHHMPTQDPSHLLA